MKKLERQLPHERTISFHFSRRESGIEGGCACNYPCVGVHPRCYHRSHPLHGNRPKLLFSDATPSSVPFVGFIVLVVQAVITTTPPLPVHHPSHYIIT